MLLLACLLVKEGNESRGRDNVAVHFSYLLKVTIYCCCPKKLRKHYVPSALAPGKQHYPSSQQLFASFPRSRNERILAGQSSQTTQLLQEKNIKINKLHPSSNIPSSSKVPLDRNGFPQWVIQHKSLQGHHRCHQPVDQCPRVGCPYSLSLMLNIRAAARR